MTQEENRKAFPIGTRIRTIVQRNQLLPGAIGTVVVEYRTGFGIGVGFDATYVIPDMHTLNNNLDNKTGYWIRPNEMVPIHLPGSLFAREIESLAKTEEMPAASPEDFEEVEKNFQKQQLKSMREETARAYDGRFRISADTIYSVGDIVEFICDGEYYTGCIIEMESDDEGIVEFRIETGDDDFWISSEDIIRKISSKPEHPGEKYLPKRMHKKAKITFEHESTGPIGKVRENSRINVLCLKKRL